MEDFGFKFKIGDVVRHIASTWAPSVDLWDRNEERFFIVSRILEECPGGIQRHYICRAVGKYGGTSKEYIKFNENELRLSEPFKNEEAHKKQ